MKKAILSIVAGTAMALALPAHAQSHKPIRLIVAFAAGGPVDFVARAISPPLSKELGRSVIVENRPGGNGVIGAQEVMRSDADGSTLWLTSVGAAAINQSLYQHLSYNMQKDFAPVSLVVNNVELFVVSPQETAKDATALIAAAKGQGKPLAIGSSGTGSIPHLAILQLQAATGTPLLHVPYNGMAPVITDILGGQIAGAFADVPAVINFVNAGKLKALGIASKTRHPLLPDVKTFEEQGFKSVDTNNWYGMFVSAKTPPTVVAALNKAVRAALADPATHDRLLQSGAEPAASSPEELAALVKSDSEKWAGVIKTNHITLEEGK
jgi:tripartite-type tricarboxylate transporter receptor subunit TctC